MTADVAVVVAAAASLLAACAAIANYGKQRKHERSLRSDQNKFERHWNIEQRRLAAYIAFNEAVARRISAGHRRHDAAQLSQALGALIHDVDSAMDQVWSAAHTIRLVGPDLVADRADAVATGYDPGDQSNPGWPIGGAEARREAFLEAAKEALPILRERWDGGDDELRPERPRS